MGLLIWVQSWNSCASIGFTALTPALYIPLSLWDMRSWHSIIHFPSAFPFPYFCYNMVLQQLCWRHRARKLQLLFLLLNCLPANPHLSFILQAIYLREKVVLRAWVDNFSPSFSGSFSCEKSFIEKKKKKLSHQMSHTSLYMYYIDYFL